MSNLQLTEDQQILIDSILKSDPPIVVVSIDKSGLHYALGNGGVVEKRKVSWLIRLGALVSNRDGLDGFDDCSPQSYRVGAR
jgi:hypothetical protein